MRSIQRPIFRNSAARRSSSSATCRKQRSSSARTARFAQVESRIALLPCGSGRLPAFTGGFLSRLIREAQPESSHRLGGVGGAAQQA